MSSDWIDFSPLDPKRDPDRFERMVRNVVSGVQRASTPAPLLLDFWRWGRLGLLAAALMALAAWLPSLTAQQHPAADAVALVSSWAQNGEVPANVDLIQTLGVLDEQ